VHEEPIVFEGESPGAALGIEPASHPPGSERRRWQAPVKRQRLQQDVG
jgi:hypothetical protein